MMTIPVSNKWVHLAAVVCGMVIGGTAIQPCAATTKNAVATMQVGAEVLDCAGERVKAWPCITTREPLVRRCEVDHESSCVVLVMPATDGFDNGIGRSGSFVEMIY